MTAIAAHVRDVGDVGTSVSVAARRLPADDTHRLRATASKQRNIGVCACCQLRQHRTVAARYGKRDFVSLGTGDVRSGSGSATRP